MPLAIPASRNDVNSSDQSRSVQRPQVGRVALSSSRQSRARNRERPEIDVPEYSESQTLPALRSTINDLKVELFEAQRDKRLYAPHITGLQEKCTRQEK